MKRFYIRHGRRVLSERLDLAHIKRQPRHGKRKRAVEKPGQHPVLSSECGTPCLPRHWSSIEDARAYARRIEDLRRREALDAHMDMFGWGGYTLV